MTIAALLLAWAAPAPPPVAVQVDGEGYLRFAREGRIVYASKATLSVREGRLGHSSGASLMPLLLVPDGASRILIDPDGTVHALVGADERTLGRITLALFGERETLQPTGPFLVAAGRPRLGLPGENGAGTLRSDDKELGKTASGASAASTAAIKVAPRSVAPGPTMRLGDFAEIQGPEPIVARIGAIDFGPTPKAGFAARITRQRVLAKLSLLGLADGQVRLDAPEVFEVGGAGQTIEAKEFESAALRAAAARFGPEARLEVAAPVQAFTIPAGEWKLETESVADRNGKLAVTLAILVDGRRINSKTVLLAGDALQVHIKAGDLVKVLLVANGIAVEVPGRARRGGRLGDSIEVEVSVGEPAVKTQHLGVVRGAGKVEVKL